MSQSHPSNPKKRAYLYSSSPSSTSHTIPSQSDVEPEIYTSTPIHDRQSTFQAHFHPALSAFPPPGSTSQPHPPLKTIIKNFQSHPTFHDADHRIVAWRKRSTQTIIPSPNPSSGSSSATNKPRTVYVVDSSDDGEKHAGKKLEKVLVEMDVEGVVVVARWYGGILLGPVRFEHVERCAREAVGLWVGREGGERKKAKLDAPVDGIGIGIPAGTTIGDEALRVKLATQLEERDASIAVLRGLLAEKTKTKIKATASIENGGNQQPQKEGSSSQQQKQPAPSTTSPAKKMDYSQMPMAKLKQLERARDATIAFVLEQLDKAEEEERLGGNGTKGVQNKADLNHEGG